MVDTVEVIEEGEVRGLTVIEPQAVERLDETATPEGMVALAARMATALADIVEKKRLYATIQGKKYPQVEAWMTIGRMDNVAAREVRGGITRVEGGGFEAEVELIRLSDGMTVGYGSAMCGTPGDTPWSSRPVHVQRSMAVTRATSRAFRQRYSWIMALAGYEPTPADEMPHEDDRPRTHTGHRDGNPGAASDRGPRCSWCNGSESFHDPVGAHYIGHLFNQDPTIQRPIGNHDSPPPRPELERRADGLQGTVTVGKPPCDLEMRETPDGMAWGFKLAQGRKGYQALAMGPLAEALSLAATDIEGQTVTVWGRIEMIPWEKDGKSMPPFARIAIERVSTPDWTLPKFTHPGELIDDPVGSDAMGPSARDEGRDADLSDLPEEWRA